MMVCQPLVLGESQVGLEIILHVAAKELWNDDLNWGSLVRSEEADALEHEGQRGEQRGESGWKLVISILYLFKFKKVLHSSYVKYRLF
jgi:hypothetical protein